LDQPLIPVGPPRAGCPGPCSVGSTTSLSNCYPYSTELWELLVFQFVPTVPSCHWASYLCSLFKYFIPIDENPIRLPCSKGMLLAHVHLGAYQHSQLLFCRAVFELDGHQHVLVRSVVTP